MILLMIDLKRKLSKNFEMTLLLRGEIQLRAENLHDFREFF